MSRCLALAATVAFVAFASLGAAGQTPGPPIVKTDGLRQVTPHVHIIPDNSVPVVPNVGIIVGEKAVLVVDTGLGPPNGAAVLAVAQKLAGTRELYLVTTHAHPEHDLGAQAFPATTKLIRSTDQVKDIAEFGSQLAKIFAVRSSVHASLLDGADPQAESCSAMKYWFSAAACDRSSANRDRQTPWPGSDHRWWPRSRGLPVPQVQDNDIRRPHRAENEPRLERSHASLS